MVKALVTGGHGFLGKHLVELLESSGYDVYSPPSDAYDLTMPDDVKDLFTDTDKVDYVFHLAANVGGIGYNQSRPYDLFFDNAVMGLNLIDQALGRGCKFIFIGTTCSYPERCPTPFIESDFWSGYPEPTNGAYGIAKRMLLAQLQAAQAQYGLEFAYVILANLYGPGDNFDDTKSHVIPALIKNVLASDEITVWGSGKPTRDFLFVKDAARALLLAAEQYNSNEPLNAGSGQEVSIADLLDMIIKLSGREVIINWDTNKPDGQLRRVLDTTKIKALGWRPQTALEDGLKQTIEWYKKYGAD